MLQNASKMRCQVYFASHNYHANNPATDPALATLILQRTMQAIEQPTMHANDLANGVLSHSTSDIANGAGNSLR